MKFSSVAAATTLSLFLHDVMGECPAYTIQVFDDDKCLELNQERTDTENNINYPADKQKQLETCINNGEFSNK